jgi:hypothetical protein
MCAPHKTRPRELVVDNLDGDAVRASLYYLLCCGWMTAGARALAARRGRGTDSRRLAAVRDVFKHFVATIQKACRAAPQRVCKAETPRAPSRAVHRHYAPAAKRVLLGVADA